MKAFGGEELYLLLILDLSTRWSWVVSFTPRPCFNHWERTEGWVGPRDGLDTEVRGNILSPLPGIEPPSPGLQPLARHYTDWATLLPYTWPNFNAHCLPQILSWLSRESAADISLILKTFWRQLTSKGRLLYVNLPFRFYAILIHSAIRRNAVSSIKNVTCILKLTLHFIGFVYYSLKFIA
jgi:hypothetical protein